MVVKPEMKQENDGNSGQGSGRNNTMAPLSDQEYLQLQQQLGANDHGDGENPGFGVKKMDPNQGSPSDQQGYQIQYDRGDSEMEIANFGNGDNMCYNDGGSRTFTRIINNAPPPTESWMNANGSEILNTLANQDNNDPLQRNDTLDRNPIFVNPNNVMPMPTSGEHQDGYAEVEYSGEVKPRIIIHKAEGNQVTFVENHLIEWPPAFEADQVVTLEINEPVAGTSGEQMVQGTMSDPTGSKPSLQEHPGQYYFKTDITEQLKDSKNKSWDYSKTLNKLFIDMNKYVTVSFATKKSPPEGSVIRILPVYGIDAHYTDPVKRCPNHASETDASNKGFPKEYLEHLIRVNHEKAEYVEDSKSKRMSVVVPYEEPEVGDSRCLHVIKFMCLGSDVGGINRRPLKIIFTLENGNGSVLGRSLMDLRICSCPKRDRQQEEAKKRQRDQVLLQAEGLAKSNSFSVLTKPLAKKRKVEDMEEFVMVPVAKAEADAINKLAESAVIARNFNKRDAIRKERKRLLEMHNRKEFNRAHRD